MNIQELELSGLFNKFVELQIKQYSKPEIIAEMGIDVNKFHQLNSILYDLNKTAPYYAEENLRICAINKKIERIAIELAFKRRNEYNRQKQKELDGQIKFYTDLMEINRIK